MKPHPIKGRKKRYKYDLIQDGLIVACVDAATDLEARREIGHYALMYSQDGPVKVVNVSGKKKPIRQQMGRG